MAKKKEQITPKKKKTGRLAKTIRDVVIVVVAFVVIRLWVIEANVIPSGSMKDTLLVGDYILAEKVVYHFRDPRVGEVVTFTFPYRDMTAREGVRFFLRNFLGESKTGPRLLIKRVQGVPGDVLELRNDVLYRNGRAVRERYVKAGAGCDWGPYVVPAGRYFMMGDNRYDSADSRFIGPVPRKYITARAEIMYFSLAPTSCPKHHAPIVRDGDGWRCEAGGEEMRVGWDFVPTTALRLDRRVRWHRVGKLVRFNR